MLIASLLISARDDRYPVFCGLSVLIVSLFLHFPGVGKVMGTAKSVGSHRHQSLNVHLQMHILYRSAQS
jgi:hypothetical protein